MRGEGEGEAEAEEEREREGEGGGGGGKGRFACLYGYFPLVDYEWWWVFGTYTSRVSRV